MVFPINHKMEKANAFETSLSNRRRERKYNQIHGKRSCRRCEGFFALSIHTDFNFSHDKVKQERKILKIERDDK